MKLSRFPRYAHVAAVLWKHRSSIQVADDDELFDADRLDTDGDGDGPEELASDLEALGPTFVKLGQLLSTRADLLPEPYLDALSRLQDGLGSFDFNDVERIVQEELGVRMSKAFEMFEDTPIAAASLGQVHRATLRNGREVAVKVQRPDIRATVVADLEMLDELAELLDGRGDTWRHVDLPGTVATLRRSLLDELDYRREAENLVRLDQILERYPLLTVPLPVDDYSSSKVLTMDRIHGVKITNLHPSVLIDIDGEALADQLLRAYLDQMLVDGFVHADPHPGNVLLTQRGTIALLDLGMVARLSHSFREGLLQLLVAVSDGRGDEVAKCALALGRPLDDFDRPGFLGRIESLIDDASHSTLQPARTSALLLGMSRIAAETGLRLPEQFVLLAKTLLQLEDIGATLAPELDVNTVMRRHTASLINEQLREMWSPSTFFTKLVDMKTLVEEMPGRVNTILSDLSKSGLKVNVDAFDETQLISGIQKIANRITSGLILAALIISAAMLMRVPSGFEIFGYPGLAMILLTIAAIGSLRLLWIIRRDDVDAA